MRLKSLYYLCILLLGFFLMITFNSWALSTDRQQSATFIADHVIYNQKKGITIFTGNVSMEQGSTHLTGDEVSITTDSQGKITQMIAKGHLAHYTELPDKQKKIIDALAETIEYYPLKALAILIDNCELKQGLNSFKAPRIVYDIGKQIIVSTPTKQSVKSVIVLQPQDLPGGNKL